MCVCVRVCCRDEISRYRLERNIFRAKYLDLKERYTGIVAQSGVCACVRACVCVCVMFFIATTESSAAATPSHIPTSHTSPPISSTKPSQPPPTSSTKPSQPPPTSSLEHCQPPTSLFSQPPTSLISQPPTSQPPPSSAKPYTFLSTKPPQLPTSSKPSLFSKPPVPSLSCSSIFSTKPHTSHHPSWPPSTQPRTENTPRGVPGEISSMAPKTVGEKSSIPSRPGVLQPSNLGEQLWDMSIIQTAPQLPRDQPPGDQNKCPQQ